MAYARSLFVVLLAAVLLTAFFGSTAQTRSAETVHLADGSVISLRTPAVIAVGKRYAFTWAGGGPAQTYTIKQMRSDGWVLVEVADEITNTDYLVPGERPVRWLNVGSAISIQEMRPHLF